MNTIEVSSFYRFIPLDQEKLLAAKHELDQFSKLDSLRGLIILAAEGINGTLAGAEFEVDIFQESLPKIFGADAWEFKRSKCARPPFRSYRVKLRNEIVTTRDESGVEVGAAIGKLSPEEWHEAMGRFDPAKSVLIDTRNVYETRLGMFENATDPNLENFQEFESYVCEADVPKDKTVYMYCTGGIRCEKASVQMTRLGYQNVFQLDGGILRYLERFPNGSFQGECFVFDGRVALDKDLNPTKDWVFCPHCGDPGNVEIACGHCGCSAKICKDCKAEEARATCSKDCAYHFRNKQLRSTKAAS